MRERLRMEPDGTGTEKQPRKTRDGPARLDVDAAELIHGVLERDAGGAAASALARRCDPQTLLWELLHSVRRRQRRGDVRWSHSAAFDTWIHQAVSMRPAFVRIVAFEM